MKFDRAVNQILEQFAGEFGMEDKSMSPAAALEVAKFIDPTGVLSWGDAKAAYDAFVKAPTKTNGLMLILAIGSVIPVMGKASKAVKVAASSGNEQAVISAIKPLIDTIGNLPQQAQTLQKVGIDPTQIQKAGEMASRITIGTDEVKSILQSGKVTSRGPYGGQTFFAKEVPNPQPGRRLGDMAQGLWYTHGPEGALKPGKKAGYVLKADTKNMQSPTGQAVTGSTSGNWNYHDERGYLTMPADSSASNIKTIQRLKQPRPAYGWKEDPNILGKERDFNKFMDRYNRLYGQKQETFNADKWAQGGGTLGRSNKPTKEGITGLLQHIGIPFREEELTRDGLSQLLSQQANQNKLYQFLKNNPIEIKRFPELYNEIADGNHRFELAKLAGIIDIPVKYRL